MVRVRLEYNKIRKKHYLTVVRIRDSVFEHLLTMNNISRIQPGNGGKIVVLSFPNDSEEFLILNEDGELTFADLDGMEKVNKWRKSWFGNNSG